MSAPVAAGTEIGRTCPYCRFALKDGVLIQHCPVCDAVHHDDCWRDGGGCAIFGCRGANSATSSAPPPPPATVFPPPPPPSSPPVPPGPRPDRAKPVLIAVIAVLVIAIAALGGFLITSRGGDSPSDNASTGGGQETAPDPTAEPPEEPTAEPTPDPAVQARRAARRIEAIIEFSLEGRTAVQQGRYADAVANRRTVLRRLRAIRGTSGDLRSAKNTLTKAMDASLRSDIAYQEGRDASASDAEATRLKAEFARQWASVAAEHDLREYAPGDI